MLTCLNTVVTKAYKMKTVVTCTLHNTPLYSSEIFLKNLFGKTVRNVCWFSSFPQGKIAFALDKVKCSSYKL